MFLHLGDKGDLEAPSLSRAMTRMVTVTEEEKRVRSSGSEFIYCASLIDATDESGKLLLGADYLHAVTVQVIPRFLWPDKPYGFRSRAVNWDDIAAYEGWRVAPGSAPGLAGDLYINYSYGSLVVWFLLGLGMKKVHVSARTGKSLSGSCFNSILFGFGMYLFAQDFRQGLVIILYAWIPCWIALYLFVFPKETRGASMRPGVRAWRPA